MPNRPVIGGTSQGPAVDRAGVPIVDPTDNVKSLNEAASRRQDDLRAISLNLVDEKIGHLRSIIDAAEKISILNASHYSEIRRMESDRVDKIRSVDVANAAATAAQLLSAVTTLATTAQATAETLRNQVAATAAAVASQTERVVNPIIERIALLEKSSYTGAGKAGVSDPMMSEMLLEIKALRLSQSQGAGKTEGAKDFRDYIGWAIAALLGLLALAQYVKPG